MRFLMLVCRDTEPVPEGGEHGDVEEWVRTMDARGVRITGDPVAHQREARAVRVRRGEIRVTDGPYLETKEYMASFYLVDVESEERAYELAAEMPWADQNPTEVWPILHESANDV